MNSSIFKKSLRININVELLFELRSILFTIARYTNENFLHRSNPSHNFFSSLNFSTISGFIEAFLKEEGSENSKNCSISNEEFMKNSQILSEQIKESKIFSTLKPKLVTLSEVAFLNQLTNTTEVKCELTLFAKEKYFIDMLGHEMTTMMKQVLGETAVIKIQEYGRVIEEIKGNLKDDEKTADLHLIIDTNTNCSVANLNQDILENQNILMLTKNIYKSNNPEESNNIKLPNKNKFDKFEEFLKTICLNLSFDSETAINSFNSFTNNQFIYKYSKDFLSKDFAFISLWSKTSTLPTPLRIEASVVAGFKRGSKLLGVPTANLEIDDRISQLLTGIPTGVYFGHLNFMEGNGRGEFDSQKVFKGVLSIGYNPYFDNQSKTIEVFLIDYEGEDFYDHKVGLDIEGFLRTEASFENFAELVTAITYDIIIANQIL